MQHGHGFHAFNTALFQTGWFVYIPEGVHVDEPIDLSAMLACVGETRCLRNLVIAEPHSSMTLIEDYESALDAAYFTNAMTEVVLKDHATVRHAKLLREGPEAFHVSELAVQQAASSRFESHSVSLSGKWTRSDTEVYFCEPEASCLMNGLYALDDGQHVDHHTTVHHDVPHCTSEQDYKGLLRGRSRAVFNGKVCVAEGAQKTESKQYNKNVLLSSQAEVDTKPELQIFADDVVCAHGATVGQLDEDALFYLATRGIDATRAHQYLIQAFFAENLKKMADVGLSGRMNQSLNAYLMLDEEPAHV